MEQQQGEEEVVGVVRHRCERNRQSAVFFLMLMWGGRVVDWGQGGEKEKEKEKEIERRELK